jgi:alcohol dehydrogenase class IV
MLAGVLGETLLGMRFEFATANRIVFGVGTLSEAGSVAREFGRAALIVTGRNTGRAGKLVALLAKSGVTHRFFSIAGEPEIATVQKGAALARESGCELVIGFGGGSALDAAKAIAALGTNVGDPFDYLEVIGRGQPLTKPSLPVIAIPTTAGTGAEVTRNAVLGSPEHRVKVSLRSPTMLPRVAIVDSELTHDLPPDLTASTGLDALTQLIEPYVCLRANPMTDALCVEGIPRVARSLRVAFNKGDDAAAREDMSTASLFGGLALANAGLGAVHGLAGPIGGMFPAPHGAICAALLPHVMETNLAALRQRAPSSDALRRFEHVARLLTGINAATADDGVIWVRRLVKDLQIPGLGKYGIKPSDSGAICEKAARASSMKPNPIVLTPDELGEVLTSTI